MKAPAQRESSGQRWRLCHSVQHPLERRILDQTVMGVRHVLKSSPPSHTNTYTLTHVCTQKCHTHTRTLQSALCLDSLTENHQGNWTLIALCASLALHVALSNIKPTKSCDNNNNVSFLSTFFQTHEHLVILEICSQIPDNTFSIQTKKTGFLKSSHLQQVAPGGL